MTVDREDLERQLGQVIPSGAERAERGPQRPRKPQRVEPAGDFQKGMGQLTKLAGISLGITALVRSSKTMQATMGAFQQTMGAMVDSFLAPLVPHLMPMLESMGGGIGTAGVLGTGVSDALESLKALSRGEFRKAEDFSQSSLRNLGTGLAEVPYHAFGPFIDEETKKEQLRKIREVREGGAAGPELFGADTNPATMRRVAGFTPSQMADFLRRQAATQPNFTFNIQGQNLDEIMSQVRSELETALRESQSQGPGGG